MDLEAKDLLTVEQAAQYLQVSQSSIRSYIRQGRLQAYRIAGKRKVLIPKSALLALLEPARPEDVNAPIRDENEVESRIENGSEQEIEQEIEQKIANALRDGAAGDPSADS